MYPLRGQQQLDLSDVTDTALLQPADGTGLMLDQFCMLFKSSFFVNNGTTTVPAITPVLSCAIGYGQTQA
jgi:hypothetical protein